MQRSTSRWSRQGTNPKPLQTSTHNCTNQDHLNPRRPYAWGRWKTSWVRNSPITEEEVRTVIRNARNWSSPSEEGLPYEFYNTFEQEIATPLIELFNQILKTGTIPHSWQRVILKPFLKEEKDPTQIASYRPISLINTDSKLLSAIFVQRFWRFAHKLFPHTQTGFTTGRSISTQQFGRSPTGLEKGKSHVILLDFEKAYDRVSHEWLSTVLTKTGLPSNFIRFIPGNTPPRHSTDHGQRTTLASLSIGRRS